MIRLLAVLLLVLVLTFMSAALLPSPGHLIGGHDVRGQFLSWWTTAREALREGCLPLWDPYQYAGYPFFSNPQVGLYYPPAWLAIASPRIGASWYVILHLWWAGLGMLLLLRHLRASWLGAFLSALTYAFSGFFAARLQAGHVGMVATSAWLPWWLLAFVWSVERGGCGYRPSVWSAGWFVSAVVAGIPFGLAILSGNLNILFYMSLIWLAFVCFEAMRTRQWTHVLRQAAISGFVGSGLGAVQMLPLIQFTLFSTRAEGTLAAFGARWSLPPFHLIAIFLPTYFGVPASPAGGAWIALRSLYIELALSLYFASGRGDRRAWTGCKRRCLCRFSSWGDRRATLASSKRLGLGLVAVHG